MKNLIKSIVAFKLGLCARIVLHRYQPHIVMVTGSVGKTSTKDAVAAVLTSRFFVRKSEKSFNSELGVPFTILGVGNPWSDPFAWFRIVRSALALCVLPNHYPNMLVLEVGADRPGDLSHILRFATPDVVVVTRLPEISVHVEAYASPEAVREEEFSPAYALSAGAPLIISSDDPYACDNASRTPAQVISYGMDASSRVYVSRIDFYEVGGVVEGMCACVTIKGLSTQKGEQGKLVVKGSVGKTQILPLAAALATALAFDISLSEALTSLDSYEPPPGRGRLLQGKNSSVIIDDSYNASPVAVEEALATLKIFPHAKRRIAILGDMLELGRHSVIEHERIASLASDAADVIVTIGIRARAFGIAPKNSEIMQFDTACAAAAALPSLIREGDVVLVKGSQSIRTERIVEALLANPTDASKLVRQEKKWKQKV
jgi:UDP-N-acetylmuramyl pentapeptide synthase